MKTNVKILIISGIFLLIYFLLVVFLVQPFLEDIKNDSLNIISEKNNYISLQAQVTELESFNKKYEVYKPNLEKMDQLFVDSNNSVNFIKFLETISAQSKINSEIGLDSSLQAGKNDVWSFIGFQISCSGNFLNILKFSEMLENSPYLVEIENITIKKSGGTAGKTYLPENAEAVFVIKVFSK